MEIYTYRARSLQEALMLVRHELGPEASVIQTREVGGKFFGLFGKSQIEVQASRDAKVVRRLTEGGANTALVDAEDLRDHYEVDAHPQLDRFDMSEEDTSEAAALLKFDQDSEEAEPVYPPAMARSSVHDAQPSETAGPINYLSPAMFEVFTEMLDADVDPDAARLMLQEVALHCSPTQLNDPWLIKGRLCQFIQQRVSVSGPIDVQSGRQQIVALVGPTGVGKTTTLAKLAAGYHFDQGTQVGMVTLDTFRLGAVDQLQKYADLMGAACEVVAAPDQMVPALHRLRHCQLVLIDTAGRSPRDEAQLRVLKQYLQIAEPTQVHLVLSAASSPRHAELAMAQFGSLGPTHLLLTKLDEAMCLGSWYRLLSAGRWPLSYLTTGQQVPEDILVANRRRVASLIMGQQS